jgi:hypothetical protein
MKRRGQIVVLKNRNSSKVIKAKVVLSDSKQGYLAENKSDNFLDDWHWYHPDKWEEVK